MSRYICIHGHFYQPPRENPWLEEIEMQDSAYPYHDWNERITAECYARNAASRLLDTSNNIVGIVNNYSLMSFNFGPTLLSWMEEKAPDVYQGILEADRMSQKRFSGHGSAIAQVYNHLIMPLASSRDKRIQILWGIKDFEKRFQRQPEGMWLAETAVDTETLEIMSELGIKFTILAPRQIKRVRKMEEGTKWKNVANEKVDPKMPYLCKLPSGREIAIFVYDGPISQAIAFEELLKNGEAFANRLMGGFDNNKSESQLVSVATDGESYGHHHRFGDMALAYCLHHIEKNKSIEITIYGEYLEKFPPQWQIEIIDNSSWSCVHGTERWRSDCGCHSGLHEGWHQGWRQPLRESLDWLKDQLEPLYENEMKNFTEDPWRLTEQYIDVILNRNRDNVEKFFTDQFSKELSEEEKIKILKLLEIKFNSLLMYTSCGWFFDEISGIETVQVIKYAARAIQLTSEINENNLEQEFIERLGHAKSNIHDYTDGAWIYRNFVQPSRVDLLRVGAHYALSSLFTEYPKKLKVYCYQIKSDYYERKEAGRRTLAIGRGWVQSDITWDKSPISFVVLHLGDHNIAGGVDHYMDDEKFKSLVKESKDYFFKSDIPDVIRLLDKYFGQRNYTLWHLFRDEQQKILNEILQSTMDEIESSFRQIYDLHYPLMQVSKESPVTLPRALATVVEFVLNREVIDLLKSEEIDIERLQALVEDMKRWSFERDKPTLNYVASQKINDLMEKFSKDEDNVVLLTAIGGIIAQMNSIGLELDLWKAQNVYFSINSKSFKKKKELARQNDEKAQDWINQFNSLGTLLQVKAN